MFSNMDLNEILQNFTKQIQESDNKTYGAKSGGGLVEATVNGKFELIDLKIDDSLLEDKESLQILIMSAVNDALKTAFDDKKSQALNLFGSMTPKQ